MFVISAGWPVLSYLITSGQLIHCFVQNTIINDFLVSLSSYLILCRFFRLMGPCAQIREYAIKST